MRCLFAIALILIMAQGCVTSELSREATTDPEKVRTTESQLRTYEDWERWRKLQDYNRSAPIVIKDR